MAKKNTSAPQPVEEPTPEVLTEQPAPTPKNCIPPVEFERNRFGLYNHIDYKFKEDGTVDWRAMIKPEYLIPDKKKTNETDITKLDDRQLQILLPGIKELAQLRGYTSVDHAVIATGNEFVAVKTTICWAPNFETNNQPVCFSALADAHIHNTKGFTSNYLSTIAENRGFVRAVRNFLQIHIVGQDEIGTVEAEGASSQTQASDPLKDIFEKMKTSLDSRKITFIQFQNVLIHEKFKGAEDWKSFDSIPREDWFELSEITKKRLAAKDAKEAKQS